MKFDFATVVEQLCNKVGLKKKNNSSSTVQYKHKDKWQKLAASLPSAVLNCMQGNKLSNYDVVFKLNVLFDCLGSCPIRLIHISTDREQLLGHD